MSYVRTVYRSQVASGPLERNEVRIPNAYRVWSTPYPIHYGTLLLTNGLWAFRLDSVPTATRVIRYHLLEQALKAAGEVIGLKAGQELAAKFSRVQRLAMGQGQCPRLMGSAICGEPALPGTVWCMWHPYGRPTGHV